MSNKEIEIFEFKGGVPLPLFYQSEEPSQVGLPPARSALECGSPLPPLRFFAGGGDIPKGEHPQGGRGLPQSKAGCARRECCA